MTSKNKKPDKVKKFFRVSSATKDIVGRDLITDDFVAIFELVKNSYDALASRVDIVFEDDAIYLIDNGKGMTENEIEDKWLFLGYSSKKDGSEQDEIDKLDDLPADFRNRIKMHNGGFAGNKGIGRFSCDRLGAKLKLSSRPVNKIKGPVSSIIVYWEDFEKDSKEEFINIPVTYEEEKLINLPSIVNYEFSSGVVLKISQLRSNWNRKKILKLKASLAKLINPFGIKDGFEVFIHSGKDLRQDELELKSEEMDDLLASLTTEHFSDSIEAVNYVPTHYKNIVNGKVQNFVFERIANNTTYVQVALRDNGRIIHSKLYDRGELILEIEEENNFSTLLDVQLDVELHYLNQAAKMLFTKYMGLQVVKFGNIFLFHNGFRVFPIGEPDNDIFGLDQRKAQGHSRYLGTRELVGRITLESNNFDKFKEASSRNSGMIKTDAYEELESFLLSKCVRLLERYVVNVSWMDKLDKDYLDLSRMKTDIARARIIEVVSKLVKNPDIKLIQYSKNLLSIIDEKSENFSEALGGLELVAEKIGNKKLLKELNLARKKHQELIEAQRKAQEEAEEERKAREKAEAKAEEERQAREEAEERAGEAEERAAEAEKRVQFFTALDNNDYESLVDYHHQIGVYSSEIINHISLARKKLSRGKLGTKEEINTFIERIEYANAKVQSIVNFATKANFILDGEETTADLSIFIPDYIEKICAAFAGSDLELIFQGEATAFPLRFKPIEFSMAIDNLVHNSRKAKARKVWFELSNPEKKKLLLEIHDNAPKGLSTKIKDPNTIFEKGVTTTDGSGLGLHYTKQIISTMGGHISVEVDQKRKLKFRIEFAK